MPLSPFAINLVSVVISTYNRSGSLRELLESLKEQKNEDDWTYEVVVVDNNSTDDTRKVVEEMQKSYTRPLVYVTESRQGSSFAKNRGVAEAKGEFIALTDDDVTVDPEWLRTLRKTALDYSADCVFGKILPNWLAEKPAWLEKMFYGKLALLDFGDELIVVSSDEHKFFGANVAIRRDVFLSFGGFNENLGRVGFGFGGQEDIELFDRLHAAKRRLVYQPQAVVHHRVPADRMRLSYFRNWYVGSGQSWAHLSGFDKDRQWRGIPIWTLKKFLANVLCYLRHCVLFERQGRVFYELKILFFLGFFGERLKLYREKRRTCRKLA